MVRRARGQGAGGDDVRFVVADAAAPPLAAGAYDVVLCRHVLWAMPDPAAALRQLARPARARRAGWCSSRAAGPPAAGLSAAETVALVEAAGRAATLDPAARGALLGPAIDDERYVVVASS